MKSIRTKTVAKHRWKIDHAVDVLTAPNLNDLPAEAWCAGSTEIVRIWADKSHEGPTMQRGDLLEHYS